jgi:hypothetical protein
MSGVVAASAFAASVFIVFLLWASRSLGVVGLLAAFAVGMISYSMDSSIEMAVAAIIVSGIAIKYALPLVQVKWAEATAVAATASQEGFTSGDAPEKIIQRIGAMKGGAKEVEGFAGCGRPAPKLPMGVEGFLGNSQVAPRLPLGVEGFAGCGRPAPKLPMGVEGFQDATTANASAATAPATAGGVAMPGATPVSAPAAPGMPPAPAMAPPVAPAAPSVAGGMAVPSAMTGNTAVGAAPTTQESARVSANIAALPSVAPGTITVPIASPAASAPMMIPVNTMGAAAGMTTTQAPVAGMMSSASAPGAAARAAPLGAPLAAAPGAAGAAPLTATIPGMTGSIAAPVGPPMPSTLPTAIAPVAQPGVTPGTAVPPAANQQTTISTALTPGAGTQGFTAGIEKFQSDGEDGLFRLGQLPAESKNGPHIDAGTTIMRALSSLNPGQINSLTEDTKKLLDTQKSLMGMLNTMKPILSDGAGLLSQFQGMFGK